jgi:putative transposase
LRACARVGIVECMARRKRGDIPAGIYHVNTRGAGPAPIFRDDDDRTMFCSQLVRTIVGMGWICRAFCFMTTHYHLLVDVPAETLQPGMRRLNGNYARAFNLRHGRSGHLFGERYYDAYVETDQHMLAILRYFARNPVEAGMCATPSDWYWGSYRGCLGLADDFPFVDSSMFRDYFHSDADDMRRFVGED